MIIKKKLIGYGYTDSNGVATLDYDENGTEISTLAPTGSSGYIGKGVGSVQLGAGLHSSETVVSETYSIGDYLVYDKATTGEKSTDWTVTGLTVNNPTDDGTVLDTATGGYTSTKVLTGDFTLFLQIKTSGNCRIGLQTSGASKSKLWYGAYGEWRYVKINRTGSDIKLYVSQNQTNWTEWTPDAGSTLTTDDCYFTFRLLTDDRNIEYKNLYGYQT